MKYLHSPPLGKLPTWGTGSRRFVPMWCMKWSVCSSLNPDYQLISSPKFKGTICWNHDSLHYEDLWGGKVLSSPSLQMGCWGAEQLSVCLHKIKVYSQHKERHTHAGCISFPQVMETRSIWQRKGYNGQQVFMAHSQSGSSFGSWDLPPVQWVLVKPPPVWESFLISLRGETVRTAQFGWETLPKHTGSIVGQEASKGLIASTNNEAVHAPEELTSNFNVKFQDQKRHDFISFLCHFLAW